MGEIVNLNKARKLRARSEATRTAEENRVRFGRTKAEKDRARSEEALRERRLDGAKRGDDPANER
jgi:hypothetical protein